MKCKICLSTTNKLFEVKILKKHNVHYFLCTSCGFIQTEQPYWLDEAYSETITNTDIGLIGRNLMLSRISQTIIHRFFNSNGYFIDYGGGYGLLVRLMRDAGFDFHYYDKFPSNLFAKNFCVTPHSLKHKYELATAFEVFEHLVDPICEIENILQFSKNVFFTTSLVPQIVPRPEEWSYYGFDHGQHVALYTLTSLKIIAQKFGVNLYSDGKFLHLLTEKTISFKQFYFFSRYKVATVYNLLFKKRSLLSDDYLQISGHPLNHIIR